MLEPRVLYRAPRHDLTLPAERPPLDWSVLEDPRNLAGPAHVLKPPYMGSATGDFVLLDRESFHEIGGFNEVYRVARIGVDRNILVKALSSGLRIADIGGPVYHENHEGSYRLNPTAYAGRETEAPWGDRRWHSGGVSYVNPPTWGLVRSTRACDRRSDLVSRFRVGRLYRVWSICSESCCPSPVAAVRCQGTTCGSVSSLHPVFDLLDTFDFEVISTMRVRSSWLV